MPTEPAAADLPSAALLRDDMQSMQIYIQGSRIVSMARERAVSRIQGWLVYRFWSGVLVCAALLLVIQLFAVNGVEDSLVGLFEGAVLMVGAARFGAIISIGRRVKVDNLGTGLASDSITMLAALGSGRYGLSLALFSANAFGLVMYALFASGLPATLGLKDGIAPSFLSAEDGASKNAEPQATGQPVLAGKLDALVDASRKLQLCQSRNSPGARAAPATPQPSGAAPTPICAAETTGVAEARRRALVNTRSWLDRIRYGLGLKAVADLFKMLLWAFVAGFFEQFVPDMLDTVRKLTSKT